MLTNCLAACAHLAITVSEIERDIGQKSSFFIPPLHSTPSLGGLPSEYRHPIRCGKTRMAWLPDGNKISKISLFILAQLTNVTDRQTDGRTDEHRMPAIAALMHSFARQKSILYDNYLLRCRSIHAVGTRTRTGIGILQRELSTYGTCV